MGIKDFFVRKMVEQKMKDVPKEQQEKIMRLVEQNPELFQKIATEVQGEMSKGTDQMQAVMKVLEKHKDELQGKLQ